jgi:N-acetylmuramoyl-L-alanine amidase
MRGAAWALPVIAVAVAACGTLIPEPSHVTSQPNTPAPAHHASQAAAPSAAATVPEKARAKSPRPGRAAARLPKESATLAGGPGAFGPTHAGILNGKIVLVDPGHNGGNAAAPAVINRLIWNGRETETCDTTGTQTDTGYTEARFNWHVALYLTADLRAEGATVVLTRTSNTGVGPCITKRAAIGNRAHANAAVSIHADGGPPGGRGFAILEPVADGINNAIIGPSAILGTDLRAAFAARTGEPVSTYDGVNGIQPRNDLAGTNLSTVPKVFIECANMRNPADAALLASPAWQAKAAQAIATGLTTFLNRP